MLEVTMNHKLTALQANTANKLPEGFVCEMVLTFDNFFIRKNENSMKNILMEKILMEKLTVKEKCLPLVRFGRLK